MKNLILVAVALLSVSSFSVDAKTKAKARRSASKTAVYNSPTKIAEQKKQLEGTYLADVSNMMGDKQMQRQFGMYKISGDTISKYSWDDDKGKWVEDYSTVYTLKYIPNNYYMTGYNLIFKEPGVGTVKLCSGDVNGDKVMDLWMSDGFFHTKQ